MHYQDTYNIEDLRKAAQCRLPKMCFDWLDGGSEDHVTWRRNRQAFEEIRFRPKVMVDVGKRSAATELFGRQHTMPIGLAPTGATGLYWHRADVALARAARDAGIPFVLSTASFDPLETVAREAEGGTRWFQLYMSKNRDSAGRLVQRALDAGFEALVVTGDVPVIGNREYNRRNRFSVPFRMNLPTVVDGLLHPRWLMTTFFRTLLADGVPRYQNDDSQPGTQKVTQISFQARRDEIDWDDVRWLRAHWPHKLFVKGVLRGDDAAMAERCGADGVFLSNHGGRQLDGSISPIDALPEVRAAVSPGFKVMVDGGIWRGSDVAKALALGADMAFVGRATLYGLAAGGEAGVSHALSILRAEFDRTLAQLGCLRPADITPDCLFGRLAA